MNKQSKITSGCKPLRPKGRNPDSRTRIPKSQMEYSTIRNPNSEIIRGLLIEDNPGDACLIKEALDDAREASFNLECAERLSTGLERLAEGGIDVVLLDLLLPDNQGLDTFTRTYAQAPEVPIIVLTGINDETLAINAVREGAQDYLVKGQMDSNLLVRSMRYAIERKRAEKVLRESQETAYALLNASMSAAFLIDTTGTILAVNEKGAQGFDKSIDEIFGLRITDFLPTEVAENRKRQGIEVIRSGEPVRFEDELEGRCFDINIYPVFNEQRMVIRLAIYARDITELRRLQEKERETTAALAAKEIMESIPDITYLLDLNGNVIGWNKALVEISGYSPKEINGKPALHFIAEEDRETAARGIGEAFEKDFTTSETQLLIKEGKKIPYSWNAATLKDKEGNIRGIVGIGRDITELKRAEEGLRESEQRYRMLVETMNEGMAVMDENMLLTFVNDKYCQMLGYDRSELIGRPGTDLHDERNQRTLKEQIARRRRGENEPYEITFTRKDGQQVFAIISPRPILDEEDHFKGSFAVVRDITERKREEEELKKYRDHLEELVEERTTQLMQVNEQLQREITERKRSEEVLRESEERFRLTVEATRDGLWENSNDHKKDLFSDRFFTMLGYEPMDPAKGFDFFKSLMHPDDSYEKEYNALNESGHNDYKCEFRLKAKDGTWRHILSRGKCVERDEKGKPVRIVGTHTDITDLKRAEEALRVSEERFALAVRGSNDGLWDWDIQNDTLYWSPRLKELLGYADDELDVDYYDTFESNLHPDDRERTLRAMEAHLKDRAQYSVEHRLRTKSGDYHWFHTRGLAIWDEARNPIRFAGSATDITERKRAEEELQREKQAVQQLAGERETVAKIGRIIGSTLEIEKVYEHFAEEVRKIIPFDRIAISLVYPEKGTFTIAHITGNEVPGYRSGNVASLAGTLAEETVRKRSSQLIQTENRDEVASRFPGLLPGFQVGLRSFIACPLISKDQVIGVLQVFSAKLKAYTEADVELAESIGAQIAGAIANTLLYQELKRQWAFSTTLIDTMSEGMGVLDEKGGLEFGNRRFFQMLGYPLEESVGMHWTSLIHPDDHSLVRAQGKSRKDFQSSTYQCRLLRKDGMSIPVLISWAPRLDDQGNHKGTVGIITDLTERKRAEQKLREYEARYSHLLDHMPDGVALSQRGRFIKVNLSMAQMFGYPSPEKIEGLHVWDLAAPVSKEMMRQQSTLRALGQQGENRFEFQALRKNGQAFPAEVTFTVDRSEPQPFVLSIFRDVTERKSYERQRRLLSDRIMTAQERERTLIARELHDELGQALTGIKMDMAWVKNHMKGPDEDVSQRFVALGELIDSTIESVRKMATSLRPSVLDRLGLAAAIEWHAGEFERRTGIECIIESEASDFNINSKTAINAYRIFQEALTNVVRHAEASHVDIRMAEDRGYLTISISDNGRGIASYKLSGPTSLGIAGMRERAELVKGRLDIQSQRGEGTRVTAYFPLSSKGSRS